jgi:hypothetical protein
MLPSLAAAAGGAQQVAPASLIRHGCFRLVGKGSEQPRRLFVDSVAGSDAKPEAEGIPRIGAA